MPVASDSGMHTKPFFTVMLAAAALTACEAPEGPLGDAADGDLATAVAEVTAATIHFDDPIKSLVEVSAPLSFMTFSDDDTRLFMIDLEPGPTQGVAPYFKAFDPIKGTELGRTPVLLNATYWAMSPSGPNDPDGGTVLLQIGGTDDFWLLRLSPTATFVGATYLTAAVKQPSDQWVIVSDVDITEDAIYLAVTAQTAGGLEPRVYRLGSTGVAVHTLPATIAGVSLKGFRLAFDHHWPYADVAVALIGETYVAVCWNGTSLSECSTGTLPTPAGEDADGWQDLSVSGLKILAQWNDASPGMDTIYMGTYVYDQAIDSYPGASATSDIMSMASRNQPGPVSLPTALMVTGSHSDYPEVGLHAFHVPVRYE
jgi:hypothetical protein